jgi:hypothetical protein
MGSKYNTWGVEDKMCCWESLREMRESESQAERVEAILFVTMQVPSIVTVSRVTLFVNVAFGAWERRWIVL